MGVFPKKRSLGKYSVIQDLSLPPGRSINGYNYIKTRIFTRIYFDRSHWKSIVKQSDMGSYMFQNDLDDAFNHITVRKQELLGSSWYDTKGQVCYLCRFCFSFGLSSPKLFNGFAEGLEHSMKNKK